MWHSGTKLLETERLILRPFAVEDADAMYRNWASDPDVTRYLTWPAHPSPEFTAELLTDWAGHYAQPDYYTWAIVLREIGEPIGSISVVSSHEKAQKAEIGYCIGKNWWHQGITSEAMGRVMDYLFGEVGFNRLESRHDPRNPYSGAVMRKCGMEYECVMRQSDWNNQGICDACHYALLAAEWRARQ